MTYTAQITIDELAKAYLETRQAEQEAHSRLEELKSKLIQLLDEAKSDEFNTSAYNVKRSQTSQMRFNSKAFRADFADVYEEYKAPVTVRNFAVTAH